MRIGSTRRGWSVTAGVAVAIFGAVMGCSSELNVTAGDTAGSTLSFAAAVCGDGRWQPDDGTEQCDDGNTESGDGCSATCQVEDGWECQTALDLHTGTASPDAPELETRWRFPDLLPELAPLIQTAGRCPEQPFEAAATADGAVCDYIRRADCGVGVVATFTFNLAELPPRTRVHVAARFDLPQGPSAQPRAADRGDTGDNRALWGIGSDKLYGVVDADSGHDTVVNVTQDLRVGLNHLQIRQPLAVALRVCLPDGTDAWRSSKASVCQTVCGNGVVDPGEACEDGNTRAGDGCAPDCGVEEGFCLLDGTPTADGAWCFAGISAGCSDGAVVCDAAGVGSCRAKEPTSEVCNGKDDDCDGEIDEPAGAPCVVEGAFGPCQTGVNTCVDGALTCVGQGPTAEVCNAVDDDCNGFSDDVAPDPCELTPEADPGCGVGRLRCDGEATVCVASPGDEVCNGRDDDCDQSVDEECVQPCGNGQLDAGESCDGTAECTPECQVGFCGDGFVTQGEGCDAGPEGDGGDTCSPTCQLITCGDGVVYAGVEACDDGSADGEADGCVDCVVSAGWTCVSPEGTPSTCKAICGDAKVLGSETCDDHNKADGDGCSSACTQELGYSCATSLLGVNACEPICGDGVLVTGEGCDDDDIAPGDGCSPVCEVEPDWTCSNTGGVSTCLRRCDAPGASQCPAGRVCDSSTGLCVTL